MRQGWMIVMAGWLSAQIGAASPPAAPSTALFSDHEAIVLSLQGPLTSTLLDRDAREERPFVIHLETRESEGIPLEVRVRGKSRAAICAFAPLRLDFDVSSTAGTLFEGQDKLKLVLPCHDNDRAERDVLEEYLAYRLFNLLSDESYRVRLLQIRLEDTESRSDKALMQRYAFLLESHRELAARIGRPRASVPAIRRSELEPGQAALVFEFEYLIGNTDWSLVANEDDRDCCHNLRLYGDQPPYLPVPFDFDRSGLVNARYAKPDPSLRLRSVTQRRYRGYCIDPDALGPALDRIVSKRSEILDLPRSLPGLSPSQAERNVRFLESFYERAEDRARLLARFQDRCL
jgi:hypothetical protein